MQPHESLPEHHRLLIPWIAVTTTLTLLLLMLHQIGF